VKIRRYIGNNEDDAQDVAIVDFLPSEPNCTIRFEFDGTPLEIRFAPDARDFLELASLVYIVDEVSARKETSDGWTRNFAVTFPVKSPALWSEAEAKLRDTLYTLSGDDFEFAWPSYSRIPALSAHRLSLRGKYDGICLFSGGLDSLAGALHLLSLGKKLLLLGHQADGSAASAQSALFQSLRKRFPDQLNLVQCRLARSQGTRQRFLLPEKVEDTHRTRSFLFLGLAVSIANALETPMIAIPENGLIALNPPLQSSRLGSLSTRTVHPAFLEKFVDLVSSLGLFSGKVVNPFICESKTDVIANFPTQHLDLIPRTVSCARPSRYQNLGVRHCGYCVPCIYRRIALLPAQLDRAGDYAFDVFTRVADLPTHKQADFRALKDFTSRVLKGSAADLQMIVLSHGAFSPEVANKFGAHPATDFSPWARMIKQWALDFEQRINVVASQSTKRVLGIK
jgi:7-cyano-7-deazaguanine synthase in queuosine biosynthesis